MCKFLSLVETDRHAFYLFTPEQRIAHRKKPLTDKHGNALTMDSHASICAFYGLDEDEVNKYEWTPYTRALDIDRKVFDVDKARVPDICLPVARGGSHGLYIELKRAKGGRVTPEQIEWLENLKNQGYEVAVCNGWETAAKVIENYLKGEGRKT